MKVEQIFTCHQVGEEKNVPLATLAFQGQAMYWWTTLVRQRRLHNNPPIEYWNDLKSAMRRRHIPSYYIRELMDKLQRLQQKNLSVDEYRQKMELYLMRAGIREEERLTIAIFLSGLNFDIRDRVELLPYRDLDDLVQLCIGFNNNFLKNPLKVPTLNLISRKSTIGREDPSKTQEIDKYVEKKKITSHTSSKTNGDLLMVKKLLGSQPCATSLSQMENIFHTKCLVSKIPCSLIVDSGSCSNCCSTRLVKKLALTIIPHPQPYKLHWLNEGEELEVN
uniref:Retrotransposon gag domain-containing protein n=1 Tax=Cajanus cajan TaxID=3821 RepID=A0A151UER0_CAJCA